MQSTKPVGASSPDRLVIEEKPSDMQSLSDSETQSAGQRERGAKSGPSSPHSPHSPRNTSLPPNLRRPSISGLRWLFRLADDALATLNTVFGNEKLADQPGKQDTHAGMASRKSLIDSVLKKLPQDEKQNFSEVMKKYHDDCDAFSSSDFAKVGDVVHRAKTPPPNLADTIASDVLVHGGQKPVLIATEDDVEDKVHKDAVEKAALEMKKDVPQVISISAGDRVNQPGWDWATMINGLMHLSPETRHQDAILKVVKEYVEKIPSGATSVYLCTANYSAFKGRIEQCLNDKGLGHIPVVDCIQVQLRREIKRFADMSGAGPQAREAVDRLLESQPAHTRMESTVD